MAKVRKDKHGLCLKIGGYVWRPVFPVGYRHVHTDGTALTQGAIATARHTGGPLLRVKRPDGEFETWFNHGAYMGPDASSSTEDHFQPDHEAW